MEFTPPALTGYIKLHRSLLRFRWFRHRETLQVFIYLLLSAGYRAASVDGAQLQPGQVIIGRRAVAEACGLTERQVRTALTHLKSTGTIAVQSTSQYSIITLTGWEKYQAVGEKATSGAPAAASGYRPQYKNTKNVYQEKGEKKGALPHDQRRNDESRPLLWTGEHI